MKINFTKREYAALLDVIYLTDWMLHSHAEDMMITAPWSRRS